MHGADALVYKEAPSCEPGTGELSTLAEKSKSQSPTAVRA